MDPLAGGGAWNLSLEDPACNLGSEACCLERAPYVGRWGAPPPRGSPLPAPIAPPRAECPRILFRLGMERLRRSDFERNCKINKAG